MDVMHEGKAKEMQRTDVRLRGRVLLVARALWLACALFELSLFSINLLQPYFGGQTRICPLTLTCPYDVPTLHALQQAHISLTAYTTYEIAFGLFFALLYIGLSVLIFYRAFDQLVGQLAIEEQEGSRSGTMSRRKKEHVHGTAPKTSPASVEQARRAGIASYHQSE